MNETKIIHNEDEGWGRLSGRTLVVIYLILMLILSGGLALQSWPDNPLRQRLYVPETERIAALQVTAEGLDALDRALAILSRLPVREDYSGPSRADLEFLLEQLSFTLGLEGCCASDSPLPPNPLRWNRGQLDEAAKRLRKALRCLENRKLDLMPSRLGSKPLIVIVRTFWPPDICPPKPPLTVSEQARVAALLADMNRPPEQVATSAVGKKIRPLLDGLQDADFMLLVLALGAWGASASALASISEYFGRRRYTGRWAVFYITRPFIGASLAFAFYAVLRGGLLSANATWTDINHVGYAAIAVLVGFCASEALENLKRIAQSFFADKGDKDGLESAKPDVNELVWNVDDHLVIKGEDFAPAAKVLVDGVIVGRVAFVTPEKLVCKAGFAALPADKPLKVLNPDVKDGTSSEMKIPPHPTGPVIEKMEWQDGGKLEIVGRRFGAEGEFDVWADGKRQTAHAKWKDATKIVLDATVASVAPGAKIVVNVGGKESPSFVVPPKP